MKLTHYINGEIDKEYNDIDYKLEKNSKKYEFFLDNICNTIYITNGLIFIRESDDYIFKIAIGDKVCCNITLKEENKEFEVKVLDSYFNKNDDVIEFKYKLEIDNDEHYIKLEIGD